MSNCSGYCSGGKKIGGESSNVRKMVHPKAWEKTKNVIEEKASIQGVISLTRP